MKHRSYKITGTGKPKGELPNVYRIIIPPVMARAVPPGTEFVPEWHDSGILLRRVDGPPPALPVWAMPAVSAEDLAAKTRYCDEATDSSHSSANGLDSHP